jgi:hypothetical protein
MRSKAIALFLLSVLLVSVAFGGYTEQKKYAIGTLHATSACTVNLYGSLYGTSYARFTLRGDTIVDTVSYYDADVQVQPVLSAGWTTIALVSDSVTLNSEGTTKFVTDTLAVSAKYISLVGTYGYRARFILTPTGLVAKQGIKNCTLWVTTYKD